MRAPFSEQRLQNPEILLKTFWHHPFSGLINNITFISSKLAQFPLEKQHQPPSQVLSSNLIRWQLACCFSPQKPTKRDTIELFADCYRLLNAADIIISSAPNYPNDNTKPLFMRVSSKVNIEELRDIKSSQKTILDMADTLGIKNQLNASLQKHLNIGPRL